MRDKERVVGMRRAHMASAPRNSRMELRRTARPSALLEYGVLPTPFSWISYEMPDWEGCGVSSLQKGTERQ